MSTTSDERRRIGSLQDKVRRWQEAAAVSRPTPPPRPAPRSRNAHQRQQGSNDPLPTAAAGNNNASLNSPPKDITTNPNDVSLHKEELPRSKSSYPSSSTALPVPRPKPSFRPRRDDSQPSPTPPKPFKASQSVHPTSSPSSSSRRSPPTPVPYGDHKRSPIPVKRTASDPPPSEPPQVEAASDTRQRVPSVQSMTPIPFRARSESKESPGTKRFSLTEKPNEKPSPKPRPKSQFLPIKAKKPTPPVKPKPRPPVTLPIKANETQEKSKPIPSPRSSHRPAPSPKPLRAKSQAFESAPEANGSVARLRLLPPKPKPRAISMLPKVPKGKETPPSAPLSGNSRKPDPDTDDATLGEVSLSAGIETAAILTSDLPCRQPSGLPPPVLKSPSPSNDFSERTEHALEESSAEVMRSNLEDPVLPQTSSADNQTFESRQEENTKQNVDESTSDSTFNFTSVASALQAALTGQSPQQPPVETPAANVETPASLQLSTTPSPTVNRRQISSERRVHSEIIPGPLPLKDSPVKLPNGQAGGSPRATADVQSNVIRQTSPSRPRRRPAPPPPLRSGGGTQTRPVSQPVVRSKQEVAVVVRSNQPPIRPLPYAESNVAAGGSGPPSRPPPKPPRQLSSVSENAVSPVMPLASPSPFIEIRGRPPMIQQYSTASVVSTITMASTGDADDDDGWGSDFDSTSDEGEEGDARQTQEEEAEMAMHKGDKLYYIVKEIVMTERTFLKGLKLLHEDFRAAVTDAGVAAGKPIVTDDVMNAILQNVEQLVQFNSTLLNQLENRMKNWSANSKIGDIMARNAPFLKLYTPYIQNFEDACKVLITTLDKNSQFRDVVRDFERRPECAHLKISAYMLETVQRIPRYKLLLKDYIKHLPEDSEDTEPASRALSIVSDVASHVNEGVKKKDNFQKMMDVARKLVGKAITLVKPGREFVREGKLMKVCRKDLQPRVLILFTDVLLYTRETQAGYHLDSVLPLNGMRASELQQTNHQHAFTVVSTRKSFQLVASSEKEKDDWLRDLGQAILDHARRQVSFDAQGNRKSMAMLDADVSSPPPPSAEKVDVGASEFVLGEMAPVWISDDSVTMCMGCMNHFTVTRRRHHCRGCGKVLCGKCSSVSCYLPYRKKKMRVCVNCFDILNGKDLKSPTVVVTRGGDEADTRNQPEKKIKRAKSYKIRPSILTEVQARDSNAQMSGYLQQHRSGKWKRRWFVLHDLILYMYKAHEDIAAVATLPVVGYDLSTPGKSDGFDKKEAELAIKLSHPGLKACILRADSDSHWERWMDALKLAVKGEKPEPTADVSQNDDGCSSTGQKKEENEELGMGLPSNDTPSSPLGDPVYAEIGHGATTNNNSDGMYSYARREGLAIKPEPGPGPVPSAGPVYAQVKKKADGDRGVTGGTSSLNDGVPSNPLYESTFLQTGVVAEDDGNSGSSDGREWPDGHSEAQADRITLDDDNSGGGVRANPLYDSMSFGGDGGDGDGSVRSDGAWSDEKIEEDVQLFQSSPSSVSPPPLCQ
eukprot:m.18415 g.18415  ORF g.18415 m.18415 type:complete len:1513 (+) comp27655_c0_seq3:29-4567(+)